MIIIATGRGYGSGHVYLQNTAEAVANATEMVMRAIATAGPGAWSLPTQGAASRLVPSDFEKAARSLNVETAAVRAVAETEASGAGFDKQKRPKLRFEVHHFSHQTRHRYDASHPHLSAPYKSANYWLNRKKKDFWPVIKEAFALDAEAAVKSASWGMFQVLGENYKSGGWSSVRQFVFDMFVSENQHMRAFLGFCRTNTLVPHIKNHNWAAFARRYNGKDYAKEHYDTKMRDAYRRYKGN